MTREEAIKILSIRDGHGIPSGYIGGYAEAIDLAIEALEAEPIKHGKWVIMDGKVVCSECYEPNFETNYCPNCGADMRGGENG